MADSICSNTSTIALPQPSSAAFFSVFLLVIYPLVVIYLICSALTQPPPQAATAAPIQELAPLPAPHLPAQRPPQRPALLRRRNAHADIRQLEPTAGPSTNTSLATQHPTSDAPPPAYSPSPSPPPYRTTSPPPYTPTTLPLAEDLSQFGAVFIGTFPDRTPSWGSDLDVDA